MDMKSQRAKAAIPQPGPTYPRGLLSSSSSDDPFPLRPYATPPQRQRAQASSPAGAAMMTPLQENAIQLAAIRRQLDAAKAANNKKEFDEYVVAHKKALAQRRELLLKEDPRPGRYPNQAALYSRVAALRGTQLPMGDNYRDFAKMFREANPKARPVNVNAAWRRYKKEHGLPRSLTSCQRLPMSMCDENPDCAYSIGMKKQGCRSLKRRSSKKSPRRKSSKRKSRSRRKPCAGAKRSQCRRRANCSWKKSKGCRRSRRRRSRSPMKKRKSPRRKSPARKSRRRRCSRGVKKTSPRKGSCRRKPGRKSRRRRSRN